MSRDITNEIAVIRNSSRGEDVRDAIISLFRMVNESSIGVTLTTAQYKQLTDEEKNNGTMYFVSDMALEDGDDIYYGENSGTTDATYVIVSKSTILDIVNAVRTGYDIESNLKLSHIADLISAGSVMVKRLGRMLTGSYISGASWYHRPSASKTYTIDIYRVPVNNTYIVGIGGKNGNRFYAAAFKSNPFEATGNMSGTSIASTNSPAAFAVARIKITWTDVEYAYIAIETSTNSNNNTDSFVLNCSAIENVTQELIELGEDDYEEDD